MEDIFVVITTETKTRNYLYAYIVHETTKKKVIEDLSKMIEKKGNYFNFCSLTVPRKRLVSCEVMNKDEYDNWKKMNL